jgi:hypothetical protein
VPLTGLSSALLHQQRPDMRLEEGLGGCLGSGRQAPGGPEPDQGGGRQPENGSCGRRNRHPSGLREGGRPASIAEHRNPRILSTKSGSQSSRSWHAGNSPGPCLIPPPASAERYFAARPRPMRSRVSVGRLSSRFAKSMIRTGDKPGRGRLRGRGAACVVCHLCGYGPRNQFGTAINVLLTGNDREDAARQREAGRRPRGELKSPLPPQNLGEDHDAEARVDLHPA